MRAIAFLTVVMSVSWCLAQGQFTQQGKKFVGSGALGIANQGQSLSISGDGTTAIVGGPYDSSGTGAAWIFVRVNGTWAQQGGKIIGSGGINGSIGSRQGSSVALSFDGNTAIVGGNGDNSGTGAAWVFTRTNSVWTQQGNKLVGNGAVDGFIGARQGESVSLSADGNTAIVGGPLDSSGAGASWVFTRSGGTWTQQGKKLFAGTASGEALQGWSVALSGDGNTAMVGGIYDFNNAGAAWIFVRSNGAWTQQGFKLYGLDAGQGANQGWSVALSNDGNTAIMGGSGDIGGTGAAWVFQRTNGVWSQEGGKLVGTGASGPGGQGTSVALSADGNTAAVGGPGDSLASGASWVFVRSAGEWTQQGDKLVGAGAVNGDYGANQGGAVALASDGNTFLTGAPSDNAGAGAFWPFVRAGTLWSQQGGKLVGSGARGNAAQGESVSISGDGNTALVGGPNDSTGEGAAWVLTRAGGAWSQQGDKIIGRGGAGFPLQARSVSLSSDGNTAVIGGPEDSSGTGATWVFTRAHPSWTQQGEKLVGVGGVGGPGGIRLGASVSVAGDGNTIIVGGPGDSSGVGAAWVFGRQTGRWSQQGNKLVGTGAKGNANQGASVVLSADGNTALVGGPSDSAGKGAFWVFVRSSGAWTQQGGKLTGAGETGNPAEGSALSLSLDGNTALVGGPNDNSGGGAVWIFGRSSGTWSQTGPRLTGSDAEGSAGFGGSVSLSADGNLAVVGGSSDNAGAGAVWVFTHSGGTWTQSGNKLVGTGETGNPGRGESVSLSGDGNTFISGGPLDDIGAGAAWVFARTPAALPAHTPGPGPAFALAQNYPNPFNPATTLRFRIPSLTRVRLVVYNMLGAKIAELVNGPLPAGAYTVTFDGSRLPSGAYICSLRAGTHSAAIRMLLTR